MEKQDKHHVNVQMDVLIVHQEYVLLVFRDIHLETINVHNVKVEIIPLEEQEFA